MSPSRLFLSPRAVASAASLEFRAASNSRSLTWAPLRSDSFFAKLEQTKENGQENLEIPLKWLLTKKAIWISNLRNIWQKHFVLAKLTVLCSSLLIIHNGKVPQTWGNRPKSCLHNICYHRNCTGAEVIWFLDEDKHTGFSNYLQI